MKIGIFGLGYIGLPRCIQFLKKGNKVFGFDIDKNKIQALKNKKSYLSTVSKSDIKYLSSKNFIPTNDFSLTREVEVLIFCLPTPLKNLKPDLSFIRNTLKRISPYIKKKQILILESTSYPGTTHEELITPLSKRFKIGENFFICFSPERDDPGNQIDNFKVTRLIAGKTPACTKIGYTIYKKIFKNVKIMKSIEEAEMSKIYENVYRAINIGLVNELKKICNKMQINFFNVIEGAKTKPYGFKAFYPGPGLGGHCIPIDPFYLTWKAKKFGVTSDFIELAGKINNSMPHWIIKQIKDFYKNKKTSIVDKKCLVLGVAYKKNINDVRESPSFKIIDILKKNKVHVSYSDPYVKKLKKYRNYDFSLMSSFNLNSINIKKFDFVILVTDHDKFNKKIIVNNSKVIFDTRNFFSNFKNNKIIQL